MAKRPNPRSIKSACSYTVPEAAFALGVSVGTIRGWVKRGLPVLDSQKPTLILGTALREFLALRTLGAKTQLAPDQLYCLRCKAGRTPYGMMLDYLPQTATTGRLTGLCTECGAICNRLVGRSDLPR